MSRVYFIQLCERFNTGVSGPFYRSWGKALIGAGLKLMGPEYQEQINQSQRGVEVNGNVPDLSESYFVAPNSTVLGNVVFGNESSAWYGSLLDGSNHRILIGDRVVIQDNTRIYSNNNQTVIGDNTFIGPNVSIYNATVEEDVYIGPGAILGDRCYVESGAYIAPGARIPAGVTVPSGEVWVGAPAKKLRNVTPQEKENIAESLQEGIKLSVVHAEETGKNFREILTAENIEAYLKTVNFWDRFAHELAARGHAVEQDELPQQEMRWKRREFDYNTNNVHNRAYQQDLSAFPEAYQKYTANFEKYKNLQEYFEKKPSGKPEFRGSEKFDPYHAQRNKSRI